MPCWDRRGRDRQRGWRTRGRGRRDQFAGRDQQGSSCRTCWHKQNRFGNDGKINAEIHERAQISSRKTCCRSCRRGRRAGITSTVTRRIENRESEAAMAAEFDVARDFLAAIVTECHCSGASPPHWEQKPPRGISTSAGVGICMFVSMFQNPTPKKTTPKCSEMPKKATSQVLGISVVHKDERQTDFEIPNVACSGRLAWPFLFAGLCRHVQAYT